jgi:hypothetical protein
MRLTHVARSCGPPDLPSYAHLLASIEAAHYCKVLRYVGRKPNVFGLTRYCPICDALDAICRRILVMT